MKDLFGNEITLEQALAMKKRKSTVPRGYAAPPGTGPPGETCRSCKHIRRHQGGARTYLKCGLMESRWTGGPGTDILAKTPACRNWEKRDA